MLVFHLVIRSGGCCVAPHKRTHTYNNMVMVTFRNNKLRMVVACVCVFVCVFGKLTRRKGTNLCFSNFFAFFSIFIAQQITISDMLIYDTHVPFERMAHACVINGKKERERERERKFVRLPQMVGKQEKINNQIACAIDYKMTHYKRNKISALFFPLRIQ